MGNATPYSGQAALSKQITDIMSTVNRVQILLTLTGGVGNETLIRIWGVEVSGAISATALDITLTLSGNILLAVSHNTDGGIEGRIQEYTPLGVLVRESADFDVSSTFYGGGGGITIDSIGNVYTVSGNNNLIKKLNSSLVETATIGSHGSGDGEFEAPFGIGADSSNNIYVADQGNNRIQKLTSEGVFISKFGSRGSGDDEFFGPVDVYIDINGNIFVADNGNNRVQVFDSSFAFQFKFGSQGSGDGELDSPHGVYRDANGNIFVVELINDRVQRFTSSGMFLSKMTGLDEPRGLVLDESNGELFVANTGSNNIYVYLVKKSFLADPLLDAFGLTDWQKYGNMGTSESLDRVAVPIPKVADNALVAQIAKDKLKAGEVCGSFNIRIVRDMRTAMEALAASGLITNITTGNTLTWDFTTDDDLYKSATDGKLAAMGRTTGTYSWTRDLPSMSGTRILDVDIAEMKLCADFLEACVNA